MELEGKIIMCNHKPKYSEYLSCYRLTSDLIFICKNCGKKIMIKQEKLFLYCKRKIILNSLIPILGMVIFIVRISDIIFSLNLNIAFILLIGVIFFIFILLLDFIYFNKIEFIESDKN